MSLFLDLFGSVRESMKKNIGRRRASAKQRTEMEKETGLSILYGNAKPLSFSAVVVCNLRDHSFLTGEQKQLLHAPADFLLIAGMNSIPAVNAVLSEVPDDARKFYFGKDAAQYAALGFAPLSAASMEHFVVASMDALGPLVSAEVVVTDHPVLSGDDLYKVFHSHSAAVLSIGGKSRTLKNHTAVFGIADGIRKIKLNTS